MKPPKPVRGAVAPRAHFYELVRQYAKPAPLRVLELGCRDGLNRQFFLERGDTYTGIDKVEPAIGGAWFHRGDFCEALPPGEFDLAVDRAALSYNTNARLMQALARVHTQLAPGGMVITCDLFQMDHYDVKYPVQGTPRWFTQAKLAALFADFRDVQILEFENPAGKSFDVVAVK